MLQFDFMRYAFIAGIFISLICGVMGTFVVARQTSFFTHTLSEIGFSGAAFGIFLGISPLLGMIIFTMASALFIGISGDRLSRRETSISLFSGIFIGLGILFLSLSSKQSSYATNILFGSIVGINIGNLYSLVALSLLILIVIALLFRQLAYNSFDVTGSQYNQHLNLLTSIVFLGLLALTISVTSQIIGSLLIFVLLTIPASSAKFYTASLWKMIFLSTIFSLVGIWAGLYFSYITNWPVTFFITMIEALIYGSALVRHQLQVSKFSFKN
ncbi:metal ABC transporter permease [Liquorilactobacillus mali]|uniref:ABC transporter permease n=1 Tax=Liquorilactobacillus mali KCTC 3596 = DSM 20444 TaxID=1046596 RepID=J1F545_9LACO|nr:metal ABC transporter permease [Liquorilactobacillus mali]EJF01297.1 ABC transporter permease [Liquorilactobacillus mali KCTC 3596 = DSM 20444]KRN08742.1 ABC transporter permease [Liquorilactobacillus mali KCTC 3596 = DSM 20444]MDC7954064.1 metal ABC transporter permease [Liquorilactobacillus mali]QFQ75647.1 metal ABC transporter permease [Liquorilactobacillus mali]